MAVEATTARTVLGEPVVTVTSTSGTDIAYQVTGSGDPTTCFVPGLAQAIAETRPFGSGVLGSRVFVDLRGQGSSAAPPGDDAAAWTYRALAADVAAVVEQTGATRALGVSLGAGALLDLVIREPDLFDRLVLALPTAIDQPRPAEAIRLADQMADAVDANDQVALGQLLLELQPIPARRRADVVMWARRHAYEIGGTAVSRMMRTLPRHIPVPDPNRLRSIAVPVLVLGQRDDPSHPIEIAEQLAAMLPDAALVISDDSWLWSGRSNLREVVGAFLNEQK